MPYKELVLSDWWNAYGNLLTGGWCFGVGTLVTMADGSLKPIENIVVGDLIYNYNCSEINRVTNKFVRKSKTEKLYVTGRLPIVVTEEHPFLVSQYTKKWNKKVADFNGKDFVKIKDIRELDRVHIYNPNYKSGLTQDELKYLGFFIGDGNVCKGNGNKTKFNISVKRQRKIDFLQSLNVNLSYNYNEKTGYTYFRLRNKSHSTLKQHLLKVGYLSHNKQIPLIYSTDEYKYILDGYLQADGTTQNDICYSGTTVSEKLAVSISIAANACGYSCGIRKQKVHSSCNFIQGRKVNARPYNYGWSLSKNNGNHNLHYTNEEKTLSIIKKEHNLICNVYNLEVTGDHTYNIQGMAVHNCEKYVENAYNKYGQFSSAYDSWNLEKANGTTYTNYPPNIECPIWFGSSWSNDLGRYGHIAIHLGDGRVASSSLSGTYAHPYIHNSIDDLINFYGQGIYYLGYSQWFCGIKLWEKVDDLKPKAGYSVMSKLRNSAIFAKTTKTCIQCFDKNYNLKFIVSNQAGRNGDYLLMSKPRNNAKFVKTFSVSGDGNISYCVDENDSLKFIYKNGLDFKL